MLGLTMTCPPDWVDRSMLVLSAPAADRTGVAANMVVTKDTASPGLPPAGPARLQALLDEQVARMRDSLANLREEGRRIDEEARSAEVLVHWISGQAAITQWVSFIDRGGDVLTVITATAGRDSWKDHEPTFRRMRESLTFAA